MATTTQKRTTDDHNTPRLENGSHDARQLLCAILCVSQERRKRRQRRLDVERDEDSHSPPEMKVALQLCAIKGDDDKADATNGKRTRPRVHRGLPPNLHHLFSSRIQSSKTRARETQLYKGLLPRRPQYFETQKAFHYRIAIKSFILRGYTFCTQHSSCTNVDVAHVASKSLTLAI